MSGTIQSVRECLTRQIQPASRILQAGTTHLEPGEKETKEDQGCGAETGLSSIIHTKKNRSGRERASGAKCAHSITGEVVIISVSPNSSCDPMFGKCS